MSYKLIKATTLTSNASYVEFDAIPQTYAHLIMYSAGDTDRSNNIDGGWFAINKDTTNGNYSTNRVYSNGSTPSGDGTVAPIFFAGDSGIDSQINSNNRTIFVNYTSNEKKSFVTMATQERDASETYLGLAGVQWQGTTNIINLRIYPEVGTVIKSGSSFYLYGVGSGSGGATVS
jgi:hypothetical protein